MFIYLLVNVNILISVSYNDLGSLKAIEERELSPNFERSVKLLSVDSTYALPKEYNYTTIDPQGGHYVEYCFLLRLLNMKVHSQVLTFGPPFQDKEHRKEPEGK